MAQGRQLASVHRSAGNGPFTIEFFNNAPLACDGTNGEGKTFIGSASTIDGSFSQTLAPLSFATGTAHLTNTASGQPDGLSASGQVITGFPVFGSIQGSRDSWSAYWELRVPIASPTWNFPGLHSLEVDYA